MANTASSRSGVIVGADVGGTTVAIQVVDAALGGRAELSVATDVSSPDATLASIAAGIDRALQAASAGTDELAAIGLGIPGQVDPAAGISRIAVNLHWYDYPVAARLMERFHAPIFLENDVRVATLGVYRFDNPAACQNLAYVSIGTGLAAGIILEGRLFRGRHGMAGEFGHFIVDPNGPPCNCGARGCLETLVSATAVVRRAREVLAAGASTSLAGCDPLTAQAVYDAAAAGDRTAQAIVDDVGAELGRALRSVVLAYDAEEIVLGGGVTRAGDRYLAPIAAEWRRQQETSALARAFLKPELIRIADPRRPMGAWGAAALAAQAVGWTA